jgi:hypothetical protein
LPTVNCQWSIGAVVNWICGFFLIVATVRGVLSRE